MVGKIRIRKILSLFIAMLMLVGYIPSFAYGSDSLFTSARVELQDIALNKIEKEVMQELREEDLAEVLVYMTDQVNVEELASRTQRSLSSAMTPNAAKLQVRRELVEALKDVAGLSQASLLDYLEDERMRGNVVEFTPYHIVNMVYVKASRDVIENIAYMGEVEKIQKNQVHTLEVEKSNEIEDLDLRLESLDEELEWNIERIKANQVWDLGYDGTGIVIANIDSGVDWNHPALKEKWRGYNPLTGETNPEGNWFDGAYNRKLPQDSGGHGTHVMGTSLGQEPDGSNKIGVAPGARWIAARVFNDEGSTSDNILLSAAEWILAPDGNSSSAPDVVNNSWGGMDGIDSWYQEAIRAWRAAGIFPVFSAGNQRFGEPLPWPGSISVPSNYPESFAVGATDVENIRGGFSKLGPSPYDPEMIKPNIMAPGVNIRSSVPGGGYEGGWNGTSMSAPAVTGVVALLLSANSSLSLEEIEEAITSTAIPLTDKTYPQAPNMGYGYGLIDAFEAIATVASGTGFVSGNLLTEGEDLGAPTIRLEEDIKDSYIGSGIDIKAHVSDDIAVIDVELLVKDDSFWTIIPMERLSGDHKDGLYKGTISHDLILGDSVSYKIRAKDYAGKITSTEEYDIDIIFGLIPGDYSQDFEEDAKGWILNGSWEWGTPSDWIPEPFDGRRLVGTNLSGYYPEYADDYLIMPPIDLRDDSLEDASLKFFEWSYMENNYDFGYVLVSDDFGENWKQVGPARTGIADSWKESKVDLTEYIGSESPIFVAFRLLTNGVINYRGWYIDNVRLLALDEEPPSIPSRLRSTSKLTKIILDWQHSPEADLETYRIYRSIREDEGFELIGETASNRYSDGNIEFNTMYYYKVSAVDNVGNESDYSQVVSGMVSGADIIFATDFEEDNGGFISGGSNNPWEWGTPSSGPNKAVSGEKLWATNLHGDYGPNTDAYIESPDIVIPEDMEAYLLFTHWVDMEGTNTLWDYGQALVSKDNGATWKNITPDNVGPVQEGKYGRRVQDWADAEIRLGGYSGETIKVRFFFHSDISGHYQGWYIDDVSVIGVEKNSGSQTNEAYHGLDEGETAGTDREENPVESSNKISYEAKNKNQAMIDGFIPVPETVLTVVETGRSVKVDPIYGRFNMRHHAGEGYTLRAEAYGYYTKDTIIDVEEDKTTDVTIVLEAKPQGEISGRVYDEYYKLPAQNALVTVMEDERIKSVITDEEGNFTLEGVYEGDYTLKIIADGFEPGRVNVSVIGGESKHVDIALKRFVGFEDEISYDDGSAENALVLNSKGHGLAMRFTPKQFGKVKGVNVYFWNKSFPDPGGDEIGFAIYGINDDGKTYMVGEPIVRRIERGKFNYIDLSELAFATDRDFYISTIQTKGGNDSPAAAIDKKSKGADRSYINTGGRFSLFEEEEVEGGLMMRARMEYEIITPKITNLDKINYTNKDTILVKGLVSSEGKVNLYLNDEKIETNSQGLDFELEVELKEVENRLRVSAVYDGRETNPSEEILIIKDKIAPVLSVEKPLDNAKINVEIVHIAGRVEDNIMLDKLLINDVEIQLDQEGNFYEKRIVKEGENQFTIRAIDKAGNETIIERRVMVGLDDPQIWNISPSEDIELKTEEKLNVSFNAAPNGQAYFRLIMPYGLEGDSFKIKMTEEDGVYKGSWTVGEDIEAEYLLIELIYINEFGQEVSALADGRLTIVSVSDMKDLPSNTIILGEEAFHVAYLENNREIMEKLNTWEGPIYIKLDKDTLVDQDGNLVDIKVLPREVRYYDKDGNIRNYRR